MRLAFIIGGGADGLAVAEWLSYLACPRGFEVDLLDLQAAGLPEVCSHEVPTPPAVQDLVPWLAAADAFVVVIPECFPMSLVDWCAPQWRARPAASPAGRTPRRPPAHCGPSSRRPSRRSSGTAGPARPTACCPY
ncbi:NADPH-dependent FMN reductase [Nonomuraea dietziae]|uniref:NADPH-dependent FMN reductase n=1 Tax=Nonomuraea dietziae TaxID=65515 RepID=UPI0036208D45